MTCAESAARRELHGERCNSAIIEPFAILYFYPGLPRPFAPTYRSAFTSFSAFWFSLALLLQPGSGVLGGVYEEDSALRGRAMGCYLVAWTIFTWMMTIAAHRTNIALFTVFLLTSLSLPLLAAGELADGAANGLTQAGGWVGLVTAFVAWYTALAGLLTPQTSYFTLPNPKL